MKYAYTPIHRMILLSNNLGFINRPRWWIRKEKKNLYFLPCFWYFSKIKTIEICIMKKLILTFLSSKSNNQLNLLGLVNILNSKARKSNFMKLSQTHPKVTHELISNSYPNLIQSQNLKHWCAPTPVIHLIKGKMLLYYRNMLLASENTPNQQTFGFKMDS